MGSFREYYLNRLEKELSDCQKEINGCIEEYKTVKDQISALYDKISELEKKQTEIVNKKIECSDYYDELSKGKEMIDALYLIYGDCLFEAMEKGHFDFWSPNEFGWNVEEDNNIFRLCGVHIDGSLIMLLYTKTSSSENERFIATNVDGKNYYAENINCDVSSHKKK
jgi:hypothetical protein